MAAPLVVRRLESKRSAVSVRAVVLVSSPARTGRELSAHQIPDVDHVLLPDRSGDWRRYIALPSPIAPASARGLIADWLVTRLDLPVLPPPDHDCPRHP